MSLVCYTAGQSSPPSLYTGPCFGLHMVSPLKRSPNYQAIEVFRAKEVFRVSVLNWLPFCGNFGPQITRHAADEARSHI